MRRPTWLGTAVLALFILCGTLFGIALGYATSYGLRAAVRHTREQLLVP